MRPWTSIEGGEHSNVLVTKHTFNSEFVCHGNRRLVCSRGFTRNIMGLRMTLKHDRRPRVY